MIKYHRPEIDGLRGVVIILIVLSHFNNAIFSSGGVNIFFVLSGYLITQILYLNDFNLKTFFKNRFYRLYPSILIISSLIIVLFILFGNPDHQKVIFDSYIPTVFGYLNFHFIDNDVIYNQDNFYNPFLPFWAFCVILQFYISYPFLLKFLFQLKKKFLFDEKIILIILSLFIIIFIICSLLFEKSKAFDFYSPLNRYWQFLAGSLVFFLFKLNKFKWNFGLKVSIIIIILWEFIKFENYKLPQLFLTISTLLFLINLNSKNIVIQILSTKILRNIGQASYFIYLIHLPIIYFVNEWFSQGNFIFSLLGIIIITFLNKNRPLEKILIYLYKIIYNKKILILPCLIILFFLLIKFNNNAYNFFINNIFIKYNIITNITFQFNDKYKDTYLPSYETMLGKNGKPCFNPEIIQDVLEDCSFKNSLNQNNLILIGGSHASALSLGLKKKLKNYNFYNLTMSEFILLSKVYKVSKSNSDIDKRFYDFNELIYEFINTINENSIIVYYSRLPVFLEDKYFDNKEGGIENPLLNEYQSYFMSIDGNKINIEDYFLSTINSIIKNKNLKLVLIYPIPEVGFSPVIKLKKYKFFENKTTHTSYDVFKNRSRSSYELLDSIEGDNVYRIYPDRLFCDNIIKNRCIAANDNEIYYSDTDHPSIKGSDIISELIHEKIKSIEKTF